MRYWTVRVLKTANSNAHFSDNSRRSAMRGLLKLTGGPGPSHLQVAGDGQGLVS